MAGIVTSMDQRRHNPRGRNSRTPQIPAGRAVASLMLLVVELKFHLQASKRRTYRERVTILFSALAQFLDEQGFSKRPLTPSINRDPWSFILDSDDLTEDGMAWIRAHLDRWLGMLDRQKTELTLDNCILALRDTLK